jgi:hypothetical protein
MHVSTIQSYTDLYFDMVRTVTRKTIVDNGEKVKEIIEFTYRPYTNKGQLNSLAQTGKNVDIKA